MNEIENIEIREILIDAYDVRVNNESDEYAFALFVNAIPVPFISVTASPDANDTIVYRVTATRAFFDAYARHFDIPDDEYDDVMSLA